MKRNLITQMRHEWRSNMWLVLELLIVSGIVCFIMLELVINVDRLMESKGFDDTDVYVINLKNIGEESPEYTDNGEQTAAMDMSDRLFLIRKLRENKLVEAASFSMNATPYNLSYMGNILKVAGIEDSISYNGNLRIASPDIVRVLRPESPEGRSGIELENSLRKGEILLSPKKSYDRYRSTKALKGKMVFFGRDSANLMKVGGLVGEIKRTGYENNRGMILMGLDESDPEMISQVSEILVRVKNSEGKRFEEEFNSTPSMQRQRNIYLTQLRPLTSLKKAVERGDDIEMRMNFAFVGFLLVIIFLGLLGSFWYRVQQRVSEIAIRKVTGASKSDIFRRFISEGTILLIIGFVLGAAVYLVVFKKVLAPDLGKFFNYNFLWIDLAATYVIMQIIILLGIWFPARKAMAVEPALALKDE